MCRIKVTLRGMPYNYEYKIYYIISSKVNGEQNSIFLEVYARCFLLAILLNNISSTCITNTVFRTDTHSLKVTSEKNTGNLWLYYISFCICFPMVFFTMVDMLMGKLFVIIFIVRCSCQISPFSSE